MCHVVWQKLTNIPEVLTASIIIALLIEAVGTSEMSVKFHQTIQCKIPEDSHLHNYCSCNFCSYRTTANSVRDEMVDPQGYLHLKMNLITPGKHFASFLAK
jgi:hypothetical protein